jgi:multidrug efflux pump
MKSFNLSAWALANRGLVAYFIVLCGVMGIWSYGQLGQSEDPPFTFPMMVVKTFWPGATADEVERQVTDRIEEKLQEMPELRYLKSYSRPGESQVFFVVRDDLGGDAMQDVWYQVRKKVGDMRQNLPPGTIGPFFNDEFGDTFGNIYALSGKDFGYAELKDYADRIRTRLLRVKDVAKVELLGVQDEKIYVEFPNSRRGELGVPPEVFLKALQDQNGVAPSGAFESASDRVYVRVSGEFGSEDAIRSLPVQWQGRTLRLGDVAEVYRGYADPASPRVRFEGKPSIGVAVSMAKGGDILRLGAALDAEMADIERTLPLGLDFERVADQPRAVKRGVSEFVRSLAEAVVIVLVVSFFSLGWRTGMVVAATIPLVLAMTFAAMKYFHIDLHKISLGALVLSLGLLVDDAIIAVEMMAVKLEHGWDRVRAAAHAYTTTAFPMLTGTLVTAAGFLPIATARSSTGEYTRSIFEVVTIALLISWVAAVVFVPYLGYKLLPRRGFAGADGAAHDPYQTRFYRRFRGVVGWCIERRWLVIVSTVAAFVVAVAAFPLVPKAFFPYSTRLELLVDLKLGEGGSVQATDDAARKLEAILAAEPGLENYTTYVGAGAPRFFLPLDQQLPAASFAQFVLETASIEDRERIREHLIKVCEEQFPDVRWRVLRLEQGPPVGFPVQFRISGDDRASIREVARQVEALVRANPHAVNAHLDTDETSKVIRVVIDQDRARALGITSKTIADTLQSAISGAQVGQLREANRLVSIELRGAAIERPHIELLGSLAIPAAPGRSVMLSQVARLEYGMEDGILWRRNRAPTITARADINDGTQPPVVTKQVEEQLASLRATLPDGAHIETGGTVEDAARGQNSVNAGMPLFIVVVLTILMFQLRSFQRVLLVVLTAPLGMIGVTPSLLVFQAPFGFIAMLGTIALSGMIMRNSVILIDQIEQDLAGGSPPRTAVIEATTRRFRPIVLTALAAVLAMVPLSHSVFFGPMAVAIMGGLIAATALTLLFLPALYAAWFKVPRLAAERDAIPGDALPVK